MHRHTCLSLTRLHYKALLFDMVDAILQAMLIVFEQHQTISCSERAAML